MSQIARLGGRVKRRLGVAKPTTIGLIFTPLQAINLLEYAETTGHQPSLILVGKSVNLRNRVQIAEVLDGVTAKVIEIVGHSGVPRPGPRQDAELAEILFHVRAIGGPIRMVFGEYRSTLAWRLVRALGLSGSQAIFVDDGAATLSIDRVAPANDIVLWDSSETIAPLYAPGIHLVTTAGPTYAEPSGKAPKVRMLTEGDHVEIAAVIHQGKLLWGVGPQGEFVRMGNVLWQASLPGAADVDLQGRTRWVPDPNYAAVAAVTFFTSYAQELRAGPDDTVIANTFPRLKRLYRDMDADPAHIIVIGSPLQVLGLTHETIQAYTLELIALARAARPGAEVVYVPHRAESDDDLAYLARVCDIQRFDMPFELAPLKVGHLPGLCATFYSSLSLNLLDLAGDRISVLALRIHPEDMDESLREPVQRVYERIAAHPAGTTRVVASAR